MTLKRELLQIVEIDVDYCSLVYSNAPCTAVLGSTGTEKCFNTFRTCQDTDNFTKTALTLRFAMNQAGLPGDVVIFPAMRGPVSTNPSTVNLGGVSERSGALGRRARVNVSLQDFTYSDLGIDKYQTERKTGAALSSGVGYDPADRGTFFGRLRARAPFYVGRPLRVKEGYVGESLASMVTRYYVIEEFNGPDANGRVDIVAKDIFNLADNKKAQAPLPSQGRLSVGIAADFTGEVDLLPATVGAEYATSGRASIGSEVVSFTRSGDTMTIVERGLDGTSAASHSEDDIFQQCYRVENQTIPNIVADLLENYADIDPSFLDTANWQTEGDRWIAGFDMTTTITKPEGVTKLITELCQFGVFFWWDETDQLVKMRTNRFPDIGEVVPSVTDGANIIERTLDNADLYEKRLTRVLFWHGLLDASQSSADGNNFARVFVAVNSDAESANEQDQKAIYEIYSRWLGQNGNTPIAAAVAGRLANRYADIPRQISFDADVKDRSLFALGSLVDVTTRVIQAFDGSQETKQMQVTSIEEVVGGHKLRVFLQEANDDNRYGFITENSRPDYGASSQAQIDQGTYILTDGSTFADGTGPYKIF